MAAISPDLSAGAASLQSFDGGLRLPAGSAVPGPCPAVAGTGGRNIRRAGDAGRLRRSPGYPHGDVSLDVAPAVPVHLYAFGSGEDSPPVHLCPSGGHGDSGGCNAFFRTGDSMAPLSHAVSSLSDGLGVDRARGTGLSPPSASRGPGQSRKQLRQNPCAPLWAHTGFTLLQATL